MSGSPYPVASDRARIVELERELERALKKVAALEDLPFGWILLHVGPLEWRSLSEANLDGGVTIAATPWGALT